MSLVPTDKYISTKFEDSINPSQGVHHFPGSFETVTLITGTNAYSVASVPTKEWRPYCLVKIAVTAIIANKVLTIPSVNHRVGDQVEFVFTVADMVPTYTVAIKDDAATPNTLDTLTNTSDVGATVSVRKFVLKDTGLWEPVASKRTSVLTTRGDIGTYGASGPTRLAIGTANQLLSTDGTDPVWTSTSKPPSGVQPGAAGATLTKLLVATATYDAASITAPNTTSTTITVTGAAVGDYVVPTLTTLSTAAQLTAYVSSTDTVTVVVGAYTGTVNLASGTLNVLVVKAA